MVLSEEEAFQNKQYSQPEENVRRLEPNQGFEGISKRNDVWLWSIMPIGKQQSLYFLMTLISILLSLLL